MTPDQINLLIDYLWFAILGVAVIVFTIWAVIIVIKEEIEIKKEEKREKKEQIHGK